MRALTGSATAVARSAISIALSGPFRSVIWVAGEVNFQVMEQRPSGPASDPSSPEQGSREQIAVLKAGQVVVDQPNLQILELVCQSVP